jgi:hypothetical protein
MKTPIDARLLAEAARFSFRFACDDCAHFDGASRAGAGLCSLSYPAAPRREALGTASADRPSTLELCKEFELGH